MILKSKIEPVTDPIKCLSERLSEYNMTAGFRKGASLVIANYLSRNPPTVEDNDDAPIAFPVWNGNRPITRAFAKDNGIHIPPVPSADKSPGNPVTKQHSIQASPMPLPTAAMNEPLARPNLESEPRPLSRPTDNLFQPLPPL